MKYLTIFIIFAIIVACTLQQPQKESSQKPKVRTILVQEQEITFPIHASGKLASKSESRLSFKTGGIIKNIYVDEGQQVPGGKLLATLDLSEVKSIARQAGLALQKAERDFERARNLYNDSVVTLEQFQDARTALELARSRDRIARFNLVHSEIHAPSQGKILKRIAEENEVIASGYPVFLFASTENAWVVRVNLTDKDIVKVSLLDSALVRFDAYPGKTFSGQVTEIGNAADPYTGTYEVELLLKDQPEKLVSGFIAKTEIFPTVTYNTVFIPVEALINANGQEGTVFIIENNIALKRQVNILDIRDDGIVISKGLIKGEEIVIEGGEYLRDNTEVQVLID
jgi:RND family efflux transporter MFP subunit